MSKLRNCIVGLIDYKAGNLHSLENAFLHIGAKVLRVSSEKEMNKCTHLVLPGVGAFGHCVRNLYVSGLLPHLNQWTFIEKKPLLGVCVGMQLFSDYSEESQGVEGLSWIGGEVKRIPAITVDIRVPHVGWNTVSFECPLGLFNSGDASDFYFDHSFAYHNPQKGMIVAHCIHGEQFCAIIKKDNIIASQFHPEKSQAAGLKFLKSFLL